MRRIEFKILRRSHFKCQPTHDVNPSEFILNVNVSFQQKYIDMYSKEETINFLHSSAIIIKIIIENII